MASIELDLSEEGEEYHYLIIRKYFKLIYFIEDESIFIAAVLDYHQNPQTDIIFLKNLYDKALTL